MDLRKYSKVYTLNFLEGFKCDSCTLCCTKKWNIDFSLKEYLETKEKMESVGEDIDNYTMYNDKTKSFITKFNGINCAFLQEDKMCFLQKNFGWEILSETCRVYPRKMTLSPRGLEISFGLSCPSVARRFFDNSATTVVERDNGVIKYMPSKGFAFIDPRNAKEGTFNYRYYEFEDKAIEVFNKKSEKLGKSLDDVLELFNEYNGLKTAPILNSNKFIVGTEFLTNIFICYFRAQGLSVEKVNEQIKQLINHEILPNGEVPRLYMTPELLEDILSYWDKEDDDFLRKYLQSQIFTKNLYMNYKLGLMNIIANILILKFYFSLNAKIKNRKLTLDEKVNLIVEIMTSIAHNKKVVIEMNTMVTTNYPEKFDELFQALSTLF